MFTNKVFLILFSLAVCLIFLRSFFYFKTNSTNQEQVKVEGIVRSEPVAKFNKISFKIDKYLVETAYVEVSVGEKVKVFGTLEKGRLKANKVEKIGKGGLEGNLLRFRRELISRINNHLPTKESAFLSGVLIGSKEALSRENKANLITTGTLHLVVVSGYNIVLVGSFFLLLAPIFGRKKTTVLALLAITVYSLLVGLEVPTLRALIMGAIALLAVLLGRKSEALYSLLLTCLVLLFINPGNLMDISFQLTFSATLGVIVFTKYFLNLLKRLPLFLRESLASTLAAQILVLPLVFFYFGNISLTAPFVNTLVLWVIPFITLAGFILLLVSFISNFLASIVSIVIYLPLKYFFLVVESFSKLKMLFLKFDEPSVMILVGYYLLIIAFVINFRRKIFDKGD